MTRQRFLMGLLAALLIFAVPSALLDRTLAARQAELEEEQGAVALLAARAHGIRKLEAAAADLAQVREAFERRLLPAQPLPAIWAEIQAAARTSGVTVESVSIAEAESQAELSGIIRYDVSVQVMGSGVQFSAFLQQLERSAYAIQIPDLLLTLEPGGKVRTSLQVGFFGRVE